MPGLVTLVSRRGEVHVDAIGTKAIGGNEPMRRDTIFRVASLTKPITAAAAMVLVEEAKLRLDDPVDPWLPEMANRRVWRAIGSALDDTVPANRPITLRDLLTFRLGFGAVMAPPGRYPIQKAMVEAGLAPGLNLPSHPPDELMKRLGSLPLLHQPGEKWINNTGSDVLGVLIARHGAELGDVLPRTHLRAARDEGHGVQRARREAGPAGDVLPDRCPDRPAYRVRRGAGRPVGRPPVFESGACGLASTVDDYLAFGQMMLNQGSTAITAFCQALD